MKDGQEKIGVTILGATGSIGHSALEVLALHPNRYRPVALTARNNVPRMLELCRRYKPQIAVMVEPAAADALAAELKAAGLKASEIEILSGADALRQVAAAPQSPYVIAAIVGAAGLLPTLAAVEAGKRVLLANKEALVMSGGIFMRAVAASGAELLPVDSEHNAIFQSMPAGFRAGGGDNGNLREMGVEKILLTASGGPFRTTAPEDLAAVTPQQAVAHPNWDMGRKISVDSATMMNKGLEVIEARWLFGAAGRDIEVLIHPQSVVHSMVAYCDGSVLAQLGNPDMKTPIAHCLAWPHRIASGVAALDMAQVGRLDFEAPDLRRFPALGLAYQALEAGGVGPAVLNAANEIAVDAFLHDRIRFPQIAELSERVLQHIEPRPARSIEAVLQADADARRAAFGMLESMS